MLFGSLAHAAPEGRVAFLKPSNSSLDPYIDHPNAWFYKDAYAVKPRTDVSANHPEWVQRDADVEMNGDGVVNSLDLGALKAGYFNAPGPDGANVACGV